MISFESFQKFKTETFVLIGVFSAGVSQLVFLFGSKLILPDEQYLNLLNWHNLSLGFGMVFSSVLGGVTFSALMETRTDRSTLFIKLFVGSKQLILASTLLILFCTYFIFDNYFLIFFSLTFISIFLQSITSVQRSKLIYKKYWEAISLQLTVEGMTRIILILILQIFNSERIFFIIAFSILPYLVSYMLTARKIKSSYKSEEITITNTTFFSESKINLLALAVSGSYFVSIFSVPVFTILGYQVSQVAAFAQILLLAKIPSTLAWPIQLPLVRELADFYFQDSAIKTKATYKIKLFLLPFLILLVSSLIAIFLHRFVPKNLLDLFKELTPYDFFASLFLAFLFIIETYCVAQLIAIGKYLELFKIYFTAILVFLTLGIINKLDSITALLNMAIITVLIAVVLQFRMVFLSILKKI